MLMPGQLRLQGVDLPTRAVPGDGNIQLQRRLARLVSPEGTVAGHLIVENVASGGSRFEWSEGCKSIKPSAKVFVHSPFNTARDYCVLVQGPYHLRGSLERIDAEAAKRAEAQQWDVGEEGYIISVNFALMSGANMSVMALVPAPFVGLPVTEPLPKHEAAPPDGVIAWGMALGQEVQSSVLSLSGKWQLPPIKQQ